MGKEKTQFKKGKSGNPGGRPKLPPDVKAAKLLTNNRLILILNKIMFMNDGELRNLLADPTTGKFERAVARVLDKADQHGDASRLEFLLNRTIGKVTDRVEHALPRPTIINKSDGSQIIMGAVRVDDESDSE